MQTTMRHPDMIFTENKKQATWTLKVACFKQTRPRAERKMTARVRRVVLV